MIYITVKNGIMVVTDGFNGESNKEEERNSQDKPNINQINIEGSRNE